MLAGTVVCVCSTFLSAPSIVYGAGGCRNADLGREKERRVNAVTTATSFAAAALPEERTNRACNVRDGLT